MRIFGEKVKVVVDIYDDRIDFVGVCVGMKGFRIYGIVRELGNENIDVINYINNINLFIIRVLSLVKVILININEEIKRVEVILKLEEVLKVIGCGGYNICLVG